DRRDSLYGRDFVHAPPAAALSGTAAARTDLRAGRSLHAARLSAAADRAGILARPGAAMGPRADQRLGAGADRLRCISPGVPRGAMAVRRFLDDPGSAELAIRQPSDAVCPGTRVSCALVPAESARSSGDRTSNRARHRLRIGALRPVVGQLDVPSATMRHVRPRLALLLLAAV